MPSRPISLLFLAVAVFLIIANSLSATQPFWSMEPSTRVIDRADSLTGFDITKYTINLYVNDSTHYIEGVVDAEVTAEAPLSSIQYRLEGGSLSVTSVLVDNVSVPFTHQNGIINIPVSFSTGQSFVTRVSYNGIPGNSPAPYNIGLKFTSTGIYTLSNPDAGRFYWPSYDHPWDKALVDWNIRVRSDWLAAANGIRTGITDNGDGTRTHHWVCSFPVATYVMGFAAAAYIESNQTAGALPIQNFVLPNQLNNAQVDFANVPQMIAHFSELYGPYPFEKYGHMVVNMSTYAAMEHQTMTTFGAQYLTGNQNYESIVAHELTHQWYGNYLTPITMREVWLKESFATYSEFLWAHKKSGWDSALQYLRNSIQQYYISWENSNGPHTIFDPVYNLMFAPPTYEKSASVLHMLRLKMGNPAFFNFIRALLTTYPNGNLNTAEFVALAQQHSGQDLTQFFQQWIYSPGIPDGRFCIFHNGNGMAKVYARSQSPTATQFWLDVPLKLTGSAVADSVVISAGPTWTSNVFAIGLDDDPQDIQIDPNHWVLTRSFATIDAQLTACLAYSGAVSVNWNSLGVDFPLAGYHVFRKTLPDGPLVQVTPSPQTGMSYTDISVVNGSSYEYYVCAVDPDGYISLPSNRMQASPITFPFDLGFLVVDETRAGNGTAFSPTDAQVDDFYATALQGFNYTEWDLDTQGNPPLSTLARYPLIFWHSDDFSEIHLAELQDLVGSYVLSGGKLILSGWKHPSVFNDGFLSRFLPGITPNLQNSAVFVAAHSDTYPSLYPDPSKLAAPWNGMLPMTYTFSGADEALYTAEIVDDGPGDGEAAALRIQAGGEMVLLGFPLYFMLPDGVSAFLQDLVPELYPQVESDDEVNVPAPLSLSLYPNPYRGKGSLSLGLKAASLISLDVYNLRGQKVLAIQDLVPKTQSPELLHEIPSSYMDKLSSGCYLIRAKTSKGILTRRISLIK